ncbi:response regulator [Actinoplanes sichuanensis]|uniref:Response regulator n=1 Tax=Actinoplanes sichuanensis TaxID=512349 RepID=A0ABW4A9Y9_9ACTN|nr:response regulator [Actinoplanes sichuanensis]
MVLVVEDDADMRELLTHLVTNAGYECVGAPDGRTAARMLVTAEPAAIILDVEMPDMDGLDLCRLVRQGPAGRDTTIVMFSANVHPDAIAAGLAAGADRYLLKPLSPRHVIAELRDAMSERVPSVL